MLKHFDRYDWRDWGACLLTAAASTSTRWLSEAPVLILVLVATAAVFLVFVMPRVSIWTVLILSVFFSIVIRLPGMRLDTIIEGVMVGLMTAAVLTVPLTLRKAAAKRRDFEQRGWRLATAESRRRIGETRSAVQRERMRLAADMHDGLGHSLTLIAVRLGRLSLAPTLSDGDREEVEGIRRAAADAADELGHAVRLLRQTNSSAQRPLRASLENLIDNARNAGMRVEMELDERLAAGAGDETASAVTHVVQEGLTNAAKHAPDQSVSIRAEVDDGGAAAVTVSNPLSRLSLSRTAVDSGFGLPGLAHRAAILDGDFSVNRAEDRFSIVLSLPLDAHPSLDSTPEMDEIRVSEEATATIRNRTIRTTVTLPVALIGALLFVGIGYFILANTIPVISSTQFSEIRVGADRHDVEEELPAMDMPEPPRADFPAREGEECRYFEESVSFFERVEVYAVCFDGQRVSRTGTVNPP